MTAAAHLAEGADRSWRPTRQDATDVAFVLALTMLGVIGFDSAFGGNEAFTVGIPAVVAGVAVGYAVAKARPPALAGAAAGMVGCLLFAGAVALRPDAVFGFLPGPDVLRALADGAVNGWARLVTSVPPAGQAGNLLAIPYLVGFWGGFFGITAALLVRRWPLCIVPPSVVMGLTVLFGTREPMSLLLQGALFGAGTIAWLCVRIDRRDRGTVAHTSRSRLVGSVALLGLTVVGAFAVGPRLPMADAQDRYVLREHVQPPFDPSDYPSPLTRFRRFHGPPRDAGGRVIEEPLLRVSDLPRDEVVRVAVMDAYDGYVWRASSPDEPFGGVYQRVGEEIPGAAKGDEFTVRFTMGELAAADSIWIPTVGSPTSISFTGDRGDELTEAFRFNRTTESAASPSPHALQSGDTWEVTATSGAALSDAELHSLPALIGEVPAPAGFADNLKLAELAGEMTAGETTPYGQVAAIIEALETDGALNDGYEPPIPSGHSLWRLTTGFLLSPQYQGNDEQYAAAVAFLARGLGIPARVVLVLDPEERRDDQDLHAGDMQARVEVGLEGPGWVLMDPIVPTQDPKKLAVDPEPLDSEKVQPPPPVTVAPPSSIPEEAEAESSTVEDSNEAQSGAGRLLEAIFAVLKLATIPLLVVFGPALVVIGLKARRRRRRRSEGIPAARIANGWDEVIDLARDLGAPVPPKATRREIARFAAADSVVSLADEVDATVFGSAEPDEARAVALWDRVDAVRAELLAGLSRAKRLRASVSLTSLRGVR